MNESSVIFTSIDKLYFDPNNPRLGRHNITKVLSQSDLLEIMRSWTLEELAESYLENNGFWIHEAVLVVKEALYGSKEEKLVVIEGNRRLAALKYLSEAYEQGNVRPKWRKMVQEFPVPPEGLFEKVPYILVDSRDKVLSFLGFRHVTGIKQWGADEKAGFIANLIDNQGLSYEQVMRKIGSKTPTVRQHYIAYNLLLQIENTVDDFDFEAVGSRFAILYDSVRTEGVRSYLHIDAMATPDEAREPVPQKCLDKLPNFALWLFGTVDILPLVRDTRQIRQFGEILQSQEAIQYLERTKYPKFEVALRLAGGDENEVVQLVEQAADNLEIALSTMHRHRQSSQLKRAVKRLGEHSLHILDMFPTIESEIREKLK